MHFRIHVALAAAVLAWSSPAAADWLGIEWGSTREQVAGDPAVRLLKKSDVADDADGWSSGPGAIGSHNWGGHPLRGIYYFEDGGLVSVELELKDVGEGDCEHLLDYARRSFGDPMQEFGNLPNDGFVKWIQGGRDNIVVYKARSWLDCGLTYRVLPEA